MAAVIFAGLDGVKRQLTPPEPKDSNIFSLSSAERHAQGIESLPKTLGEALHEFKHSDFMRECIGEHVFQKYIDAKEEEWKQYRTRVSQWEIDNYLGKY